MLGPVDIEDWGDNYADLCARVRQRQEFVTLKCDPQATGFANLDDKLFALLARFCAEEKLSENEVRCLIEALKA